MTGHDIVVVGGGPAGLAAAAAAYDRGVRDILILDREEEAGGILRQCVHNGFGLHKLGKELTGPEYADHYVKEVQKRGIPILTETTVTSLSRERVLTVTNRSGLQHIAAKAVILAMGCRERSRGALSIAGERPAGVYSAGTAQKLINMNGVLVGKRVVILGSGDIGLIMARRMTLQGAKVEAVCEILPYSGGLRRNIVQCLEDYGIPLYLSTTVAEIHGKERVEGVTVVRVDEKRRPIEGTRRLIPCDTLLLSCGLIPENELTLKAGIEIDPVTNGAVVDQERQTELSGVFACGNVLQVHDLVDYVSDEAELAGKGAADFVLYGRRRAATVAVHAGEGIRYVLPQWLAPTSEPVDLFLRVKAPTGPVRFTVRSGDRVLFSKKALKSAPGEMERIRITGVDELSEDVTVELEELK